MSHRHFPSRFRVRPLLLAVALANGFAALPAGAQPAGAQAIHGSATLSQQGANLLVTTQNGAGTRHSAINWQSFSIPGGSTTHFAQPDAASTSINRVLGGNPSAIFGTLSSNGRLVLVNPAGITVGAGAVVDTAGFTASTLRMTDADAIAGRLRFGDGSAAGPLRVDGRILAGSGDVVLIGTDVQAGAQAVIQSPQGATVLAAGQKVELTGRGLEGIRLEVQAPADQAVNLGTLQGDAVGIFAGTLRHSGLVQANAASVQGGRVLLKATGDALVDGTVTARAGDRGGSIDVFGRRVGLLAGAALDASGDQGGGQIRVGGDYQGLNAGVPNAERTYVDEAAVIKADATQQGDGGRVIVWSDEMTRMHGRISARGGAQGGDGGFAEVSGRQHLEFTGLADLRAPQGAMGTLLLDPQDVTIFSGAIGSTSGTFPSAQGLLDAKFEPTTSTGPVLLADSHLNAQLAVGNVIVKTNSAVATGGTGGQITVNADAVVQWSNGADLALEADKGITILGTINGSSLLSPLIDSTASLHLNAKNGSIVDGGTGSISVGQLYATATNGSVALDNGHAIDVVAGATTGSGTSFTVHGSQDLAVGTVNTAWGGGTGISSGGITVKAGRYLSVDAALTGGGGPIALEGGTSSSDGAIYIRPTGTLASGGGTIDLQSLKSDVGGTSVLVQGQVDAGAGAINVRAQSLDVTGAGMLKRTGAGDINLAVDGLRLANTAGTSVQSTGGRIVINPLTANALGIELVGANGAPTTGAFALDAGMLAQLEARTLVVGQGSSPHSIRLTGDIAFNAAKVSELSLITSSTIYQDATSRLTVDGVNLDANSVSAFGPNAVNRVSGRYDTWFDFHSDSALSVDTVDGIAGVKLRSPLPTPAPTPAPALTITSAGKLSVNQDITGADISLEGTTVDLAGGRSIVAANGGMGGLQIDASGDGVNNLSGGLLQSDGYLDIGGNGSFVLGDIRAQYLNLYGGVAATPTTFSQGGGTIVADSVYASLDSGTGSRLDLSNTANQIGSLSAYVAGDIHVASKIALDVSYVDGVNVTLKAAGISSGVESGLYATGDLNLFGTSSATSDIDLTGAYVYAGGNFNLANARDAVLGNTEAGSITANLSGSLSQDSFAGVTAVNGVTATVGGDITLLTDSTGWYANDLGYVAGSAGGSIRMSGVRGVAAPGLNAGTDVELSAFVQPPVLALAATSAPMAVGDLDVIGNVFAGNRVTLTSDSGIVIQDGAAVSAPTLEFNAPLTTVYGKVKPGGIGGIGTARATGTLHFAGAGTAELDVVSLTSFDQLIAGGDLLTDATTSLNLNDLSGGSLLGSFQPVSAGAGSSLSYTLPAAWGVSATNPFVIVAGVSPAPAPAPIPAPAPGPVTSEQAATLQTISQVIEFARQFEDKDKEIGKDDIVVTDVSCKPAS